MPHRLPLWAAYLIAGATANLVILLLPDGPGADAAYLAAALSGALAIVAGTRRHRPHGAAAWYLVAAGLALSVVGGVLMLLRTSFGVELPVVPEFVYLLIYPFTAAGIALFTHSRDPVHRPAAVLDAAVVTSSAGLVAVVFLIIPAWTGSTGIDRWIGVLSPLGNLVLFGTLVRLAYASGAGRPAVVAVAAALGGAVVYQGVSNVLSGLPTLESTGVELNPVWLLPYVLAGTVALHPSMRRLSKETVHGPDRPHGRQVAAMGLALGVGPSVIGLEHLARLPLSAGPVALFYVPLVLFVSLRMLLLVRQINDEAVTDHLTGLPNRRALHRESRSRLADPTEPQALLMIDLDRFKEVNDSLGHPAGDDLLTQVAGRLRTHLRADDLLVRLGGDEFAVVLEGVGAHEARAVATTLHSALREPFSIGGGTLHSSGSIGVALFPFHGTDLPTLMRKADIAMYHAKSGSGVQVHDDEGDDSAARLQLSEDLRAALADDQLVLHYQPKVDLGTGAVRGVEALVRWQHPTKGLLPPDAFLPLVETTGLMGSLTRTVLAKALDQAATWRAAGRGLTVAVNISTSSLSDDALPRDISDLLARHALPPASLQLEITEDVVLVDHERARGVLEAFRTAGITVAVDDFGTGYSSLSYLRDLPIDELKLDKSFVLPMGGDPLAGALVSSTITLAHALGLRMVAEGVEDQRAYDALIALGCDQAQGYLMSHPLPAHELDLWLERREPARTSVDPSITGPRNP